jgi:hypothetical protein
VPKRLCGPSARSASTAQSKPFSVRHEHTSQAGRPSRSSAVVTEDARGAVVGGDDAAAEIEDQADVGGAGQRAEAVRGGTRFHGERGTIGSNATPSRARDSGPTSTVDWLPR